MRKEHSFTVGYTIVKDYIHTAKLRSREMFVPLTHAPGEAQADFGEAWVEMADVKQDREFFLLSALGKLTWYS